MCSSTFIEDRIQEAARNEATELDLSSLELTSVPESVLELVGLHHLNLSNNALATLPDGLSQLRHLKTLQIRSNSLALLPDSLGELRDLQQLDLEDNELGAIPSSFGQLKKLRLLDIQNNNLNELPDSLGSIVNLQYLHIGHNILQTLPSTFRNLTHLRVLSASDNRLSTWPDALEGLRNLRELILNENSIAVIPTAVSSLQNLRILRVGDNRLSEISEMIGCLKKLRFLDFINNALVSIPRTIGDLQNLEWLDLDGNLLKSIPPELGNLVKLKSLDLRVNDLTGLPDTIGDLRRLQHLVLFHNLLETVPSVIGRLTNLRHLDLDHNRLTTLPNEVGDLRRLKTLDLRDNALREVPESLAKLKSLQRLFLEDNKLTSIPDSVSALFEHGALEAVFLHKNPQLGLPPEILGNTRATVSDFLYSDEFSDESATERPQLPRRIGRYLRQIDGGLAPQLQEARLIVVGPGGAGKSSLIECLTKETFTPGKASTHGVVVQTWPLCPQSGEPIRVNIWDFGGQELQHSTHEFFLAERAVYLLVYNARQDQGAQSSLYYWLDLIRTIAPAAPIIVALSQQDLYEGHVNDAQDMVLTFGVREFVPVSCTKSHQSFRNIAHLQSLIDHAVRELDHVTNRLPSPWMDVKKSLEAAGRDFLPYGDFRALCESKGINDPEDQQVLMRFLHDIGTMLNYADQMPLEDTHILNPKWVTEAVYALVLSAELKKSHGVLKESLVARLDKLVDAMLRRENRLLPGESVDGRYPPAARRFILEIMRRFELCHQLTGGVRPTQYLVPNALPAVGPESPEISDSLRFELYYPRLLPTSVISRFMVHMQARPDRDTLWRQGIQSELDGHPYLVTMHDREKRIRVSVGGLEDGRLSVLDKIRHGLTLANRGKRGLEVEAEVPLPNDPGVCVKYDLLVKLANAGERTHTVVGSDGHLQKIVPEQLLGRIGDGTLTRLIMHRVNEKDFSVLCRQSFPEFSDILLSDLTYRAKVQRFADAVERAGIRNEVESILEHPIKRRRRATPRDATVQKDGKMNAFRSHLSADNPRTRGRAPAIGATDAQFPSNSIRVLHLSDLHFTGQVTPRTKLQWLADDLNRDLNIDKLDIIVISGDFTDKGQLAGLDLAADFIKGLCDRFNVSRDRCVLVPGNHDVQDVSDAYIYQKKLAPSTPAGHYRPEGTGFLVRNQTGHARRFEAFSSKIYREIKGVDYPSDYEQQGIVETFPQFGLQFVCLNSAWEIDEIDYKRSSINESALARVLHLAPEQSSAGASPDLKPLQIGVWHHSVLGPDQMKKTEFLGHLQKQGMKLALHGDIHEFRRDWIGYWEPARNIHVVGSGSFASPKEGRKESIPRLYNLLEIHPELRGVRVHTRAQEQPDGPWEGWNKWPGRESAQSGAAYPYFDVDFSMP